MSGGNSSVIEPESKILMPEPALEAAHRRTRLILAVGLGGMILLMLAAGIDAVRVLQGIREQSDLIRADALAHTGTLASIRTKLLSVRYGCPRLPVGSRREPQRRTQ
jgi:hypothetical protein